MLVFFGQMCVKIVSILFILFHDILAAMAERSQINENFLGNYVLAYNMNGRRAAFSSITADNPTLNNFPVLNEDYEYLIIFALGTYQLNKLAVTTVSEHIRANGFIYYLGVRVVRSQSFFTCHDDPSFDPDEGPVLDVQFTWLGTLQYIHVKNATPHYFRVPRVLLIHKQFVMTTAVDAARVPEGYALGNAVFGDYERDENECRLTVEELAAGATCEPAVLLMPIADVLIHPEYKHFGATNSLALLKLIRSLQSHYMLPVCLPFKDFLMKNGRQVKEQFTHIDFMTDSPRDFIEEAKEVTKIALLPRELCYLYDHPENKTNLLSNRLACTTGCGFHSGSPVLIHEHTGHWTVVALALGNSPCPDPLRAGRPPAPPRHLLLHPYVPWITAAVTGRAVGGFSKDDPFGFVMPRQSLFDKVGHDWVGHWWMGGIRCYDRGEAAEDMFRFYREIFQIKPTAPTNLNYYLEINAASDTTIICVKVGVPYRSGRPKVWELDSNEAKVRIPLITFTSLYRLQVEAWAYNNSLTLSSESSSIS